MNRVIPIETKVKVMQESLCLTNVEEIAACYEVSAGAIYYWFNEKVKPALGEVLKNDPPGPEPRPDGEVKVGQAIVERPETCEQCGGRRIRKNGTYWVINWVWLLSIGWLVGLQKAIIQRTRYIGLAKTHLQHILISLAMNLVRTVHWLNEEPLARTQPSAFVRFCQAPGT